MPESKKVVVKVDAHDDKDKKKVMKAVSRLSGVESLAMDMKDKKLTVIGDVDPVCVVGKLKCWHPVIETVGPVKKDEKKEEKKDDKKDDDDKKKKEQEAWEAYCRCYNPYMTQRYCVYSVEENPNACVIC